jgi:CRP-like cAMP-binding protein
MFVVLSGQVRLFRSSSRGGGSTPRWAALPTGSAPVLSRGKSSRASISKLVVDNGCLFKKDVVEAAAVLAGGLYSQTVIAETETEVMSISQDVLNRILRRDAAKGLSPERSTLVLLGQKA